jgi:hypothetical protein
MSSPLVRRSPVLVTVSLLASVAFAGALTAGGCGRTSVLLEDLSSGPAGGGGPGSGGGGPSETCGDRICNVGDGESCTSCVQDCGVCEGCGESCATCADRLRHLPHLRRRLLQRQRRPAGAAPPTAASVQTRAATPSCRGQRGLRVLPRATAASASRSAATASASRQGGEDCLSCAPDCDACESCGDGVCSSATENCFTCAPDCGVCEGCGDGFCSGTEQCDACTQDCGVCSVCGNGVCEADEFETCSNCNADCGECDTIGCFEIVTCAIGGCIDLGGGFPPDLSLTCFANCVAQGCADVQFFVDQRATTSVGRAPSSSSGALFSRVRSLMFPVPRRRCPKGRSTTKSLMR